MSSISSTSHFPNAWIGSAVLRSTVKSLSVGSKRSASVYSAARKNGMPFAFVRRRNEVHFYEKRHTHHASDRNAPVCAMETLRPGVSTVYRVFRGRLLIPSEPPGNATRHGLEFEQR